MRRLVFDKFEIRPEERLLLQDGKPNALGARAFDLLLALLERRDRVVSKNELLDLAWPGTVVEENNLSVQISSLRKVLGAQAIATVTGRGYRFVAALQQDELPALLPLASTLSAGAARPEVFAGASSERITRRLAAIACADLVGWDAALASDAPAAIRSWRAVRSLVIEPQVANFGGRIVDLSAQGLTLEFSSAVDAIRWGMELQDRLAEQRRQEAGTPVHLRVGIVVDDVIVDDGKLIGDGVHGAGRLLSRAAADQVLVSDGARRLAERKLAVHFRPLARPHAALRAGDNDAEAQAFAVETACQAEAAQTSGSTRITWDRRPGVAVLPFATDGQGDDSYFGDGVTEEIITAMAGNRGLLVIDRNSTLRYRGSGLSTAQIAAELQVRYLLSGSVRRLDQRIRIGAELVDASANRTIWAEHYDGAGEDLFGFQARIAASIAGAIDPRVHEAEFARLRGRPTDSLGAYDSVLRGMSVLHTFRGDDFAQAGTLFRRAIALDPHYAQAHAYLAWWHNLRFGEGRSPEFHEDMRAAEQLSQRAIELDPQDAWSLSVAGHVQSFVRRRFDVAMDLFDQALVANPNCAVAWARSGTTLAYLGQAEEALERVRCAMRLSPFDLNTFAFLTTNGSAAFVAGRNDEAIGWLIKARRHNPGYRASHRMLVAALALAGDLDEARAQAQEFLQTEPGFRVSVFGAWYPLCQPHLDRLLHGMRLGGLPD